MKKKLSIALGALSFVLFSLGAKEQMAAPRARLTVRVLDEQGVSVQGAQVTLTFFDPDTRQGTPVAGTTNGKGEFSGEDRSTPKVGGRIQMEKYYPSGFPFEPFRDIEDGRWVPWNPTFQTVLRPIGKPIAMYAKDVWINIPSVDQPCGYDLEKGDWVAPNGKGVTADLVFKLTRRYMRQTDFDASVNVSFSNPRDGIQEAKLPDIGRYSAYKWPREAPDDGYAQPLPLKFSWSPNGRVIETANEQQAYFFRVRTVEQNGEIVGAHYGKIRGGLFLSLLDSKTCKVRLTYHMNPTALDRNMEWDPKRNLITGLSWEENPREP